MFPSPADIEKFKSDFGPESYLGRKQGPESCVTFVDVSIKPQSTKALTLVYAWELFRAVAEWILEQPGQFLATEKYAVVVRWSISVGGHKGHVFKHFCSANELRTIVESSTWMEYNEAVAWPAPPKGWEKDVFPDDSDDEDEQLRLSSRFDAP